MVRVSMSHVVTVGSPQLLEPALSGGVGSPFAIAARRVSINIVIVAVRKKNSRRNWTCDQASILKSRSRAEVGYRSGELLSLHRPEQEMRLPCMSRWCVGTDRRRKV
jgi:hypothetical protein